MKYSRFLLLLVCLSPIISTFGQAADDSLAVKYGIFDKDNITPDEYRQRRDTVLRNMEPASIAVFRANNPCRRNGDMDYRYRQDSDFLYLTGSDEPNSTLILIHDGIRIDTIDNVKEILFVLDREISWSGSTLGVEGVKEVLGFSDKSNTSVVLTNNRLWDLLPYILKSNSFLFYTPSLPDIISDPISDRKFVTIREIRKGIEEKYPGLAMKNAGILTNSMRAVKSPAELVLIRKAVDATAEGQLEAMRKCAPKIYEYQLQAVIENSFTRNGCESAGFSSIIGSGPNSLIIHYSNNRRKMNSGELVVMDAGAEYHGYSADVSRTIPVNGRFSPAQKEIYELVLSALETEIAAVRPGIKTNELEIMGSDILENGLLKLGILKDKNDKKKYLPHLTSHSIGLDVHDSLPVDSLEPGIVLAIEPGIYIPDSSDCNKKYWGIGVRIEDDVVVTEDGYNVLSDRIPRTASGIEKLMKKR